MSEICVMSITIAAARGDVGDSPTGLAVGGVGQPCADYRCPGLSMSADLYAAPQHVDLTHVAQVASEATLAAPGGRSMQDPASELPRIPLPRTRVNRGTSRPSIHPTGS